MKKSRLLLNTLTGVFNIINCVVFASSWFVVFGTAFSDAAQGGHATDGATSFFYAMAWIGVVLNAIALIQSKRHSISVVGGVLGLIGSLLFGFTGALAFPAIVLLIISVVFLFLQHPSKEAADAHTGQAN
ncbi:transporter [Lactobacillus amylolyticus]|uniref:transporter n=1 Tax=Lactobacillus amylolyticus TaxID=83683 RepID=UPI00248FD4EF|nr:transporter [Lactobacillus amylolyticus]